MHQEKILKETSKQENSEEIFPFLYKSYTQFKKNTRKKQKGGKTLFLKKITQKGNEIKKDGRKKLKEIWFQKPIWKGLKNEKQSDKTNPPKKE